MGKTKTVFVGTESEGEKSGKAAYEEKKRKQQEALRKEEAEKAKIAGLGLKGGERIKVVGGELPQIETPIQEEEEKTNRVKKAKVRSKKYIDAKAKINREKLYELDEAIKLIKEATFSKFDGTMEMHLVVKKENISENISLPYSTGKSKRIEITNEQTIEKLNKGKIDFDVLLATVDMMPKLVPFAKILGPKGLMPNPKNGTLIKDEKEASKFSGNTLQIKTQKDQPVIHTFFGKVSQPHKELVENAKAIFDAVGSKVITKAYIKSTMSPSVKILI